MNINPTSFNKIVTNCTSAATEAVKKANVTGLIQDTVSFSAEVLSKGFTKLSQEVSHRFPDKGYRVVSLPKGMEIVKDGFKLTKKVPTVAIVDMFGDVESVKLDKKITVPHGVLTTKYAVEGLEDKVGVLAFGLEGEGEKTLIGLNKALETLSEMHKKSKNIDALNLSVGESIYYSTLSKKAGIKLSYENIEDKRNELLQILSRSTDERLKQAYSSIQYINELVDNGVKVYSASGNMADEGIDLLSLSKAHIVSASDYHDSNTVFVTDKAKGRHVFKKIYDEFGKFKEITDGKITLKAGDLCTTPEGKAGIFRYLPFDKSQIRGTSYSCPVKLNEDLKTIF